ncbi:MAG: DUF367 family protein [Candidatus Thermoplasmatota archaeon]|nr:DUF367 family protein [Candidatus Thermoplasmatota archaeon]
MIRISYVDERMDDPRKSTMRKLSRFGMAYRIDARMIRGKVLLWPFADKYLTARDKTIAEKYGLCVIETSWKRIEDRYSQKSGNQRKLPLILPVNPVNFGKPGMLSSVEAIASSLYIMGENSLADSLLSKFPWAHTFHETNMELLNAYSSCGSNEEVISVQAEFF